MLLPSNTPPGKTRLIVRQRNAIGDIKGENWTVQTMSRWDSSWDTSNALIGGRQLLTPAAEGDMTAEPEASSTRG